jgi:hypothetical protein
MTIPDPEALVSDMVLAVDAWNQSTPRGQQSLEHKIGISDVGHCREYVRRMTVKEDFTDDPDEFQAFVGTAIGEYVELAMQRRWPQHVQIGVTTVVTLPSGIQLPGHPDIVVLKKGVIDVKTVDGLTQVKRQGPSLQQQFQRHLYAAGLVQEGRLPEDCWVANAFYDRSGRDPKPYIQVESYDPSWLIHADEWLSDVTYAIQVGEEAPKDKPVDWCVKCCEFVSSCRADVILSDREHGGLIEDPELLDMIDAYIEARDAERDAERAKEDAKRALAAVSGRTATHVVKWIHVNESDIAGFTRAGYERLDIKPLPKATRK